MAATLAYAARGRPPFGSGPVQAIHFRMMTGRCDLGTVPSALAEPLRAALDPDPAQRPSAAELRDRLRRLDPADLDLSPAPSAGATTRPVRAPGHGTAAAIVLALCLLTYGLTAAPTWIWAPWGIIAGGLFTWLRLNDTGPSASRRLARRVPTEAAIAMGTSSVLIWTLMVFFALAGWIL
jgi:hypothetical protein